MWRGSRVVLDKFHVVTLGGNMPEIPKEVLERLLTVKEVAKLFDVHHCPAGKVSMPTRYN